jgi:hypothetical protein
MLTNENTLKNIKPLVWSEWSRKRDPLICQTKEHLFKHLQESTWRSGAGDFVVLLSKYARSMGLVIAEPEKVDARAYGFTFSQFTNLEMSNLSMLLMILDHAIREDPTFLDYGLAAWDTLRKEATAFLLSETFEVNKAALAQDEVTA